ncbi:hypothetical protein ASPU41_02195 [Arthrobacter sp. U41]|nr:hypothetical protein ASPU41_02195 [Arthrobacter sp. U41]
MTGELATGPSFLFGLRFQRQSVAVVVHLPSGEPAMVDTRVVLAAEVVVACGHVLPELATWARAGLRSSR